MGSDVPGCDDDDGLTAEEAAACSDVPIYPTNDRLLAAARNADPGDPATMEELRLAVYEFDAYETRVVEWSNEKRKEADRVAREATARSESRP